MKNVNYLPLLAIIAVFSLAFGGLNASFGQGNDDEGVVIELDDELLEDAEAATREQEDAEAEPAAPAPRAQSPQPTGVDPTLVNRRLDKVEAQTTEMLKNQQKINEALVKISEDIRQARIFASRSGGGVAPE